MQAIPSERTGLIKPVERPVQTIKRGRKKKRSKQVEVEVDETALKPPQLPPERVDIGLEEVPLEALLKAEFDPASTEPERREVPADTAQVATEDRGIRELAVENTTTRESLGVIPAALAPATGPKKDTSLGGPRADDVRRFMMDNMFHPLMSELGTITDRLTSLEERSVERDPHTGGSGVTPRTIVQPGVPPGVRFQRGSARRIRPTQKRSRHLFENLTQFSS